MCGLSFIVGKAVGGKYGDFGDCYDGGSYGGFMRHGCYGGAVIGGEEELVKGHSDGAGVMVV